MQNNTFPKTARIRQAKDFEPALKGRKLSRGVLLVLSATALLDPSQAARLGLVIGKRNAPLSVTRNTIKRVLRDAFRHYRLNLPPRDYVVRLHTRVPDLSLTQLKIQIRSEIEGHLKRAQRMVIDKPIAARPSPAQQSHG